MFLYWVILRQSVAPLRPPQVAAQCADLQSAIIRILLLYSCVSVASNLFSSLCCAHFSIGALLPFQMWEVCKFQSVFWLDLYSTIYIYWLLIVRDLLFYPPPPLPSRILQDSRLPFIQCCQNLWTLQSWLLSIAVRAVLHVRETPTGSNPVWCRKIRHAASWNFISHCLVELNETISRGLHVYFFV